MLYQDIPQTTKTTVDLLLGPPSPKREARVAEIASIYQTVLKKVVAANLIKFCGPDVNKADIEDLTGDEIIKILDPQREYFKTYSPSKGRLRHWIKARIRYQVIDYLRKKTARQNIELISDDIAGVVDQQIDYHEYHEVFRLAILLTRKHFNAQGRSDDFNTFMSLKSGSERIGKHTGKSEWQLRKIKSEVSSYIRDAALIEAALQISDHPADVSDLSQRVWDVAKSRKNVDLNL